MPRMPMMSKSSGKIRHSFSSTSVCGVLEFARLCITLSVSLMEEEQIKTDLYLLGEY